MDTRHEEDRWSRAVDHGAYDGYGGYPAEPLYWNSPNTDIREGYRYGYEGGQKLRREAKGQE